MFSPKRTKFQMRLNMHFTYNEADPVGLTALVQASAIHNSIRIVSNNVTITPAQSEKDNFQARELECDWTA